MDRIDRLLRNLVSEQDDVTHYNESASAMYGEIGYKERMAQLRAAQARRDALRQQIVDEWRAKDAALELSLEWFDEICGGQAVWEKDAVTIRDALRAKEE